MSTTNWNRIWYPQDPNDTRESSVCLCFLLWDLEVWRSNWNWSKGNMPLLSYLLFSDSKLREAGWKYVQIQKEIPDTIIALLGWRRRNHMPAMNQNLRAHQSGDFSILVRGSQSKHFEQPHVPSENSVKLQWFENYCSRDSRDQTFSLDVEFLSKDKFSQVQVRILQFWRKMQEEVKGLHFFSTLPSWGYQTLSGNLCISA